MMEMYSSDREQRRPIVLEASFRVNLGKNDESTGPPNSTKLSPSADSPSGAAAESLSSSTRSTPAAACLQAGAMGTRPAARSASRQLRSGGSVARENEPDCPPGGPGRESGAS